MTTYLDDIDETPEPRMYDTCTRVDTRALHQALRELVEARNYLATTPGMSAVDRSEMTGSMNTLVRCVGFMLGGVYHVGYDKVAADLWHRVCATVRLELSRVPVSRPCWYDIDAAVLALAEALLPLALDLAA